jgi:hypothetical protein
MCVAPYSFCGPWQVACLHVEKKTYDIFRHIFVTSAGRAVDQHRDWVTTGGYSEHSLFIDALVNQHSAMKAIPRGPKHSQPKKKGRKVGALQTARGRFECLCAFMLTCRYSKA